MLPQVAAPSLVVEPRTLRRTAERSTIPIWEWIAAVRAR
jgi:hypothetical protein